MLTAVFIEHTEYGRFPEGHSLQPDLFRQHTVRLMLQQDDCVMFTVCDGTRCGDTTAVRGRDIKDASIPQYLVCNVVQFHRQGACRPLPTFTPALTLVDPPFAAGVRQPYLLGGVGVTVMAGMSSLVQPTPAMIVGFVIAAAGMEATMLLSK